MRLCTICARGGSKGVPGKNIRPLLGKPLIVYSIEQAKASKLFDAVAVSSDSDEILKTAQAYGADVIIKRPAEMATDEAGKVPAIAHAVQAAEKSRNTLYNIVVDLDATSPLRTPQDIVEAVNLLEASGASSVITGAEAHRSPYFNLVELDDKGIAHLSKPLAKPVLRRQDSPRCYDMNASIYVWQRDKLLKEPKVFYPDTRLYAMPCDRSFDIDDELDFAIVELILTRRNNA